jgi:hypothetical protein
MSILHRILYYEIARCVEAGFVILSEAKDLT